MKHVGLCSALIVCCLSASAWAVRYGERTAPQTQVSVSNPATVGEVPVEESYAPWQVYGYSAYDQSAIAKYNPWPQVCIDGLWDNFCNERHCSLCRGSHGRGQHGAHAQAGCNNCQNSAGRLGLGHHLRNLAPSYNPSGGCVDGNCGSEVAQSEINQGPALEMEQPPRQLNPEPELEPASPSDLPVESSAQVFPRTNPIRQPLLPALWRSQN